MSFPECEAQVNHNMLYLEADAAQTADTIHRMKSAVPNAENYEFYKARYICPASSCVHREMQIENNTGLEIRVKDGTNACSTLPPSTDFGKNDTVVFTFRSFVGNRKDSKNLLGLHTETVKLTFSATDLMSGVRQVKTSLFNIAVGAVGYIEGDDVELKDESTSRDHIAEAINKIHSKTQADIPTNVSYYIIDHKARYKSIYMKHGDSKFRIPVLSVTDNINKGFIIDKSEHAYLYVYYNGMSNYGSYNKPTLKYNLEDLFCNDKSYMEVPNTNLVLEKSLDDLKLAELSIDNKRHAEDSARINEHVQRAIKDIVDLKDMQAKNTQSTIDKLKADLENAQQQNAKWEAEHKIRMDRNKVDESEWKANKAKEDAKNQSNKNVIEILKALAPYAGAFVMFMAAKSSNNNK